MHNKFIIYTYLRSDNINNIINILYRFWNCSKKSVQFITFEHAPSCFAVSMQIAMYHLAVYIAIIILTSYHVNEYYRLLLFMQSLIMHPL